MVDIHDSAEQVLPSGRETLFGAAVAAAVLAGYVWLAGGEAVVRALGQLSPAWATTLALSGGAPLLIWGVSLWIVFAAIHRRIPVWKAIGLFLASVYLNSVTPFGQLGGDPPSALLIARESGTSFESGLAAVGSVNALNRLAVVCLGLIGVAWYTARIAVAQRLQEAVVLVVGLGAIGVAVVAIAWLRRDVVADVLATLLRALGSQLPFVETPSRAATVERIDEFVAAVERLASHPRVLVAAFLLGVAGQVAVAGVLWLVLVALGVAVPIPFVLLVIPAAKLAGLTPLPGGSGPAEALLSGLLVTGAEVSVAVAAAAALLYRAVAFWLPTVLGGLLTIAFLLHPSEE
ncbi:MAG: lysylphosphatidylglycerol synthase transmembrane domain-containing protein [Halolamina sp.]|uniref:lysylphosphatidylglycerol synthase transmembrane domain-containing protein n=1 Tax=Halolamina sp. TaxID=1940283 RepID=UPI002FC31DAA